MYEEHPEFSPPPLNATLWRYIDFTKFVSLLDREALFFSRLDKLGDPFEGSVPKATQDMRPVMFEGMDIPSELIPNMIESFSESKGKRVRRALVNCWHENENESEAMWKLYGGASGIAIKTTFKKLSDCLIDSTPMFIGRIKYIDYDTTIIGEGNILASLLVKRKSFEHEQEVRIVSGDFDQEIEGGNYYKVDTHTLIHEVVVAPYSPRWFVNLVESVATRYDLKAPISKSGMDAIPLW